MERFVFDDAYVRRLLEGDRQTQEHFDSYFRDLLRAKARGRVPPAEIDDVVQTTFARVYEKLAELREGAKLGAFVFGICDNVVREQWRRSERDQRTDAVPVPQEAPPVDETLILEEARKAARETLNLLPKRDSDILRAVFLEEADKDEVCRRFGIERGYLRVLLHRAIDKFRRQFK